jgi:hypothetical protein
MEISQKIIDDAKRLLSQGAPLPAEVSAQLGIFVTTHEDKSVHALASVQFGDFFYKIGSKKDQRVRL